MKVGDLVRVKEANSWISMPLSSYVGYVVNNCKERIDRQIQVRVYMKGKIRLLYKYDLEVISESACK